MTQNARGGDVQVIKQFCHILSQGLVREDIGMRRPAMVSLVDGENSE
jgi:hypothetical protein